MALSIYVSLYKYPTFRNILCNKIIRYVHLMTIFMLSTIYKHEKASDSALAF